MPDLKTLLASYDLAFLRDIAELWGIELQAVERRTALVELANAMTSRQLFEEVFASLHPSASAALMELSRLGGKMPGRLLSTPMVISARWGQPGANAKNLTASRKIPLRNSGIWGLSGGQLCVRTRS